MDELKQLLNTVLQGFQFDYQDIAEKYFGLYYRRIVMSLNFAEDTLRDQFQAVGISYSLQTIILVALPFLFAFATFRILRGKIKIIAVLAFLALGLHVLIPALGH